MNSANKKQLQSFLFSTAGVAVMFVTLIAVYIIAGVVKVRLDLTQERLYTLSNGTRAILEKVAKSDTPVLINYYCTQDSKEMPVQVSNVLLLCNRCGKGVKTGARVTRDGSKERFCKKCGTGMGEISPPKEK